MSCTRRSGSIGRTIKKGNKMNKRMLTAGVLAALALGTVGGARSQESIPALPYALTAQGITAQGHGEVKVKPDIALLTLTVTTQSADQAQAVRQNAQKTTTLLAALHGAGLAEKDIETQSYTVQPQYDDKPSPPVLTGYQVQNTVQATVRDLTKVGFVLDKATAGGASEVGGVSFDLSDRASAQSSALALAVRSARRKASVMADAAGVSLGRLLTLTEGSDTPVIRPFYAMRAKTLSDAAAPETPIADQQITVTADATLVYAMGAAK